MSENVYAAPSTSLVSPQNRAIWTKELKSARTILIVVGIIQMCFGIFYLLNTKSQIRDAKRAEVDAAGPAFRFDEQAFEESFAERKVLIYVLTSIPLVIGVYFFIMAALVFKFPVPVTLSSLLVYVASHIADACFDPTSLAKGIVLKVIFLVTLWKAFQSAKTARAAVTV